jgi:flagellar hook-associated protein 2
MDGMKSIIDKSGPGADSDLFRNVKSNMLLDFVTTKSSISDIDKSISEMNRKIDDLNVLLAKKEDSYYAKFTQMEKYMQQMSSQSGWLSQQFG